MDISLQPYKYYIFKPDYYSFVTDAGVEYIRYFTPYDTYFKTLPAALASKFYSFNLELANKNIKPKG